MIRLPVLTKKSNRTSFLRPLQLLVAGSCLVACAHSKNLERNPQTDHCELTGSTLTLTIPGNGVRSIDLDVPDGVTFSEPIAISCQDHRTIIVTPEGVIRTLGLLDVATGREMLGLFSDGIFRPQNAILFYTLGTVGKLSSASIDGNCVIFESVDGKSCRVNADSPFKPAICKQ
ncbi:MAG: hypothetical protein ABII22_05445 [Candidatus Micrarchaeota archaeon]